MTAAWRTRSVTISPVICGASASSRPTAAAASSTSEEPASALGNWLSPLRGMKWGDVDGDGRPDMVYLLEGEYGDCPTEAIYVAFSSLDASNRQTCRVRTEITSTPLHALTTLNDPTWVEAARVLAERSWKEAPDLNQRLTRAFRLVLSRAPSPSDQQLLRRAYDRQLAIYAKSADDAKKLLAVGAAPRNPAIPEAEHAALTAVCLGILNLDEALTRE